jgi:hypothetical protein
LRGTIFEEEVTIMDWEIVRAIPKWAIDNVVQHSAVMAITLLARDALIQAAGGRWTAYAPSALA